MLTLIKYREREVIERNSRGMEIEEER